MVSVVSAKAFDLEDDIKNMFSGKIKSHFYLFLFASIVLRQCRLGLKCDSKSLIFPYL
jgi:hypothetical protein